MGSFSWLYATNKGIFANFTPGDEIKILIPECFGGGHIVGFYEDYGKVDFLRIKTNTQTIEMDATIDLDGLVAYFNHQDGMIYDGEHYPETIIDIIKHGKTELQKNRCKGIDISCYTKDAKLLTYPLKIVPVDEDISYEDCEHFSSADPNQGFYLYSWDDEIAQKCYNDCIAMT